MKKEILKLLSATLKERYKGLSSGHIFQPDKMQIIFENESSLEIRFDTLKAGIKEKGAFLISYSLTVNNTELYQIKQQTGTNTLEHPLLYFGKEMYILPESMSRHDRYIVCAKVPAEVVIFNIVADFDAFVLPLAAALCKDYALLLPYFDNKDFLLCLKDAYATAYIAAFLSNSEKWTTEQLPGLVDKYAEGPLMRFYDYRKSPDPEQDIAKKITVFFDKK
ncbi:hypothetical protein [Chitinophaga qingshengii]|uniref:Uncharacterized protein n=1 Tax=Chitinophaga qingshengii TaxID=1569794 RepID=A0ABR7TJV1_9BACT|nr:hypothetical protein [Chitinophaga qingshengii]MBC9929699.1 hypothetical protein [Chitinophaga qingshengii]